MKQEAQTLAMHIHQQVRWQAASICCFLFLFVLVFHNLVAAGAVAVGLGRRPCQCTRGAARGYPRLTQTFLQVQ